MIRCWLDDVRFHLGPSLRPRNLPEQSCRRWQFQWWLRHDTRDRDVNPRRRSSTGSRSTLRGRSWQVTQTGSTWRWNWFYLFCSTKKYSLFVNKYNLFNNLLNDNYISMCRQTSLKMYVIQDFGCFRTSGPVESLTYNTVGSWTLGLFSLLNGEKISFFFFFCCSYCLEWSNYPIDVCILKVLILVDQTRRSTQIQK